MDTVVVTRAFEGDVGALVAFCRTLDSRKYFPGANLEGGTPGKLHFNVGMRLKAATMTDLFINETLGDVETLDDGVIQFDTSSWANWPDGQSGAASEYMFTPGSGATPHTLRLTYNYTAPGKTLVKVKALPAFHDAMEKVIVRFVEGMIVGSGATLAAAPPAAAPAAAPSTVRSADSASVIPGSRVTAESTSAQGGMHTVVVSRAFDTDLQEMVRYTRSLDSRANWPGVVLEYEKRDEALFYGIGMRLIAATMTDITVEERLGDVEELETGETRYSTAWRMLWPEGHIDAIAEYLFVPGSPQSPQSVRLTYSYPAPSTKLVKTKELGAFKTAMEKVIGRYLKNLSTSVVRS
ncbi:MAG: hypothetical protein ACT4PP_12060 [Sporichthyaceae bacterium]